MPPVAERMLTVGREAIVFEGIIDFGIASIGGGVLLLPFMETTLQL